MLADKGYHGAGEPVITPYKGRTKPELQKGVGSTHPPPRLHRQSLCNRLRYTSVQLPLIGRVGRVFAGRGASGRFPAVGPLAVRSRRGTGRRLLRGRYGREDGAGPGGLVAAGLRWWLPGRYLGQWGGGRWHGDRVLVR